jgi:hypothetical protein
MKFVGKWDLSSLPSFTTLYPNKLAGIVQTILPIVPGTKISPDIFMVVYLMLYL